MGVKIIVLDDGETWAGGGTVMDVTADAFDALCRGDKRVKDLDGDDILDEWDCNISPPDSE